MSHRVAYFSICPLNYLHHARTLAQSLAAADPSIDFHLFIADRSDERIVQSAPELHIIALHALGIPYLLDMAFRYEPIEFSAALKPFCIEFLFDQRGYNRVIYLAPDMFVLKPLTHVAQMFDDGADCILTPHVTRPIDDSRIPSDLDLMRAGTYNLGFCAFAYTPDARSFIEWWRGKLATKCLIEPDRGIFVDQRYCDFAPAFIARAAILRHPGYNLAYWNLIDRSVTRVDGEYRARGEPVYFVHFSGIEAQNPDSASKHQDGFDRSDLGEFGALYDGYFHRLIANNRGPDGPYSDIPYGFGEMQSGLWVKPWMRRYYGTLHPAPVSGMDPFSLPIEFFAPAEPKPAKPPEKVVEPRKAEALIQLLRITCSAKLLTKSLFRVLWKGEQRAADYWRRCVLSPSLPEAATAAEPAPPLGRTQGSDFKPCYKVTRFSNESWLQTEIEEARSWYRVHGRKVVILIPSYRDTTLLQHCINSVQTTTNPNMIEILVVDDASADDSHVAFLTALSKLHANITVIFGEKNVGFAGNINRGLKVVSHDVVLMNSDVVAHEGWLEVLQYTVYSTDSAIGTSRLLYENGSIQFGGGMRSQTNIANFDHFHRRKPPDYLPALVSAYTFYATGAIMYLRFNTLSVLSYFDPAYEMAFEDVDYCVRAWSQGLRVVYAPASCLNHKEGATRGTAFRDREKCSQDLFWTKQKSFFERNVLNCEGKPQVIFVCETTGVGGGHRVIYNFLNHLSSAGFDAQLWNLQGYPEWFPLRPSVTLRTFGSYHQLAEALDQQDAIKVATWWKTSEPVWLGSVRRGIPVYLVQDIESSYYTARDDINTAIKVLSRYRPEFNYATITQWVKSELATSFNFNAVCVGVGYQDDKFRPLSGIPRRKRTILVVARSEPLKNFSYSQDILQQLSLEGVQVLAYGLGIHKHLVQELGSVEFFFKPSDEELCELYNQADFFLQTSRHEGFGLPSLEAMACGCAVVTTDAIGNREYISDGENCIVIPIDNSREAVRKILAALADDQLQQKIRAGGIQTAKLYAQNLANKRAEKFFRAIVSRPVYGVQIRESDLDTHH